MEFENPVTGKPGIPWQVFVMVALCVTAGPVIFYYFNKNWPRVVPGIPAWEPNAALAARTESVMHMIVAGSPVTDVLMALQATKIDGLFGKPVRLTCVESRAVLPGRGFWTAQAGTPPIFVAADSIPGNLAPGKVVLVEGTIEKPGNAAQWPAGVIRDQVYVRARRVEVLDMPVCGGI